MSYETNRMKLAYWTGIIKEAKSSGMKISEWCQINQVTYRQFYYWHKKVMHTTYSAAVENGLLSAPESESSDRILPTLPEFVELPIRYAEKSGHSTGTGVSIKWSDFTITIDPEFSERELIKVLKVMKHV